MCHDVDDVDDEDVDITEIVDMLAVQLEAVVQETVIRPSLELARLLADLVAEADLVAFAIVSVWRSGGRRELDTPDVADTVLI